MPALNEATDVRQVPHVVEWEANRSGARITIIGVIDGQAGKLTVDTISGANGQVVAWKDGSLAATLAVRAEGQR